MLRKDVALDFAKAAVVSALCLAGLVAVNFAIGQAGQFGLGQGQLRLRGSFLTSNDSFQYENNAEDERSRACNHFLWLIFGVVFYFQVVKAYPTVYGPSPASSAIISDGALNITFGRALFNNNFFLGCCCFPARQALNFHATNVHDYWIAFLASFFCPCPMTWYGTSRSGMNSRVGGMEDDCLKGMCLAFFCSCCVVIKQAEAIDAATGVETKFCSVVTADPLPQAYAPMAPPMSQTMN